MKLPQYAGFRSERERFALRFTCEHCALFDPDHAALFHPADMPSAIAELCRCTGQPAPTNPAASPAV